MCICIMHSLIILQYWTNLAQSARKALLALKTQKRHNKVLNVQMAKKCVYALYQQTFKIQGNHVFRNYLDPIH